MKVLVVSVEEAARVLGVTGRQVRNWITEGRLRVAPRVGRKHRIYIESVAELAGVSEERVLDIIRSHDESANNEARLPVAA